MGYISRPFKHSDPAAPLERVGGRHVVRRGCELGKAPVKRGHIGIYDACLRPRNSRFLMFSPISASPRSVRCSQVCPNAVLNGMK